MKKVRIFLRFLTAVFMTLQQTTAMAEYCETEVQIEPIFWSDDSGPYVTEGQVKKRVPKLWCKKEWVWDGLESGFKCTKKMGPSSTELACRELLPMMYGQGSVVPVPSGINFDGNDTDPNRTAIGVDAIFMCGDYGIRYTCKWSGKYNNANKRFEIRSLDLKEMRLSNSYR